MGFQQSREFSGDVVRGVGTAIIPLEYIVILLVLPSAQAAVFFFRRLRCPENVPGFLCQGERAVTGGIFGFVLLHRLGHLGHRVTYGHRPGVKVNAVPFQAQDLAAAQSINGCDFQQRVQRLIPYRLKNWFSWSAV